MDMGILGGWGGEWEVIVYFIRWVQSFSWRRWKSSEGRW